jgi:hypothetical protein
MSQNSFVLDGNIDAIPYGNNLQSAFQALVTNSSGSTAPTTTYAFMTWYDTTTGLIKQRDSSNTTWIVKGQITTNICVAKINEFRLSPVTGDAVGTSASTGTIFFTPYIGNSISLYDSTNLTWKQYTLSEQSIVLSCATNTNVDIFAYDNGSGSVVFEQLAWTNNTTRATALVRQDGVWVKSGTTNRRYVGSYRSIGVNLTQCDEVNLFIFNADNQIARSFRRLDTTGVGQTLSAATGPRSFKNSTSYTTGIITGLAGSQLISRASVNVFCTAGTIYYLGIGLNSTTIAAPGSMSYGSGSVNFSASIAEYSTDKLPVGFNTLNLIEQCPSGTVNTSSTNVITNSYSSGMTGSYQC